jgi:futalosine hydrolase
MNILIVAATSLEIDPLLKKLEKEKELFQNLTRYRFDDLVLDVLITGVGMVATAYWTGKVLANYKYDAAINAGICGSFNRDLVLGEVVNVISDMFPETGAESGEYFLSLLDLKLLERDEFPFKDGKLVNNSMFKSDTISGLKPVSGVTVNTVHGNSRSIARFRERFEADVESMEGASFFYSCFQENVRCLQLRAISNYVEPRDTSQWKIGEAIRNMNLALMNILSE